MIRDIILMSCVLFCLALTFRHPFAGILAWAWLTLQQPHREVFGYFSSTLRINLVVALVTIAAWLFSKERKFPPIDATGLAFGAFLVWMTINAFYALSPVQSWEQWDRDWRIMALALMVWVMPTNKARIHALIWIAAISLMYYGIKGGVLSIIYAGHKKIDGPPETLIGDNNNLAVALLMILPLINYLRMNTASRWVRIGLIAGFAATFAAVVGSYSRGAFLALGALGITWWLRSKNKVLYLAFAAALAAPVFYFMPQDYYDRIATLHDTDTDASFQARLMSWKVSYYVARDHFPFGAGFDGPQQLGVFNRYFPNEPFHAAHSIYFQVLGDTGFIGLGLYLIILSLGFVNCFRIRRATRNRADLLWARELATMIQLSLVAFCVGGAALSLAYYDLGLLWIGGILPSVLRVVSEAEPRAKFVPTAPRPAFAPDKEDYLGPPVLARSDGALPSTVPRP
jgi:probable O-glycosylation ligase (exosortase A-associated)